MKSELRYTQNPLRSHLMWAIVYSVIIILLIFAMYKVADRIRIHTLPTGQVELKIPYSKYLVGEVVTFTLKNNFNSPIYVSNNCPSEPLEVYRLDNNKWVRQHDEASLKDCHDEQRQVTVPANGIVNGSFAPWHNLFNKPGKYRVVAYVEYYNALPYQDFEVIEMPKKATSEANSSANSSNGSDENDNNKSTQTTTSSPPPPAAQPVLIPPYTSKKTQTVATAQGSITVQYDATNIYVTSIAPASGCTFEGGRSGTQVEVTFKCPGNETQVQLIIVNGKLVQKVETGGD